MHEKCSKITNNITNSAFNTCPRWSVGDSATEDLLTVSQNYMCIKHVHVQLGSTTKDRDVHVFEGIEAARNPFVFILLQGVSHTLLYVAVFDKTSLAQTARISKHFPWAAHSQTCTL